MKSAKLAVYAMLLIVMASIVVLPVFANSHSPWDSQNVAILLDRGNYWANETMTIQTFMLGNFSNTLEMWLNIVNDTGGNMWQENWQPNASLIDQVHTTIIAVSNQTIGHFTVQVTWDHRMTTTDFWILGPSDPVPVSEFQSQWLLPLALIPITFIWRKRSCRSA
jgi:hypothetical protein